MRTSRQHVRDRRRPRAPAKRRSAISAIERAFTRLTLTISVGAAVLFGALDPLAIRLINAQARPDLDYDSTLNGIPPKEMTHAGQS